MADTHVDRVNVVVFSTDHPTARRLEMGTVAVNVSPEVVVYLPPHPEDAKRWLSRLTATVADALGDGPGETVDGEVG